MSKYKKISLCDILSTFQYRFDSGILETDFRSTEIQLFRKGTAHKFLLTRLLQTLHSKKISAGGAVHNDPRFLSQHSMRPINGADSVNYR